MHALLHHPVVQAGLAPFLVALVTAELFLRIRLSGLALIAGFATTVYLTADFNIEPLTLNHKIIWLGLLSSLAGLLFSLLAWSWLSVVLIPIASAVTIWLLLPMLQAHVIQSALVLGTGCAVFMAILTWGMDALHTAPLRAANAATALGVGTGVAVFGGASALYGQFALALGAGAGAHLLIQMIANQSLPTGRSFTLPAAMIVGAVACVAVLNGHLPWYCLPLLAAIPIVAWVMPLPKSAALMQSLLLGLFTFGLAAGAVYLSGFHFIH